MDIKGHSTMIIAMAIAVVIMTGVMVPVISDALDSAGGGSSGSSAKPYENSGTSYLKAWDSNEHLISITDSNVNVVFNYDGTDVLTMAKGSDGWCIPVFVCEYEENGGVTTKVVCFTYYIADGIGLTNMCELWIWQNSEGTIEDGDKDQIYASAQDTVFTIEIYEEYDYRYADISMNETLIKEYDDVTKYLSDENGEYVYAKSPVVADGTEVIQMNCYYAYSEAHGSTPSEFTIIEGFSKGNISYLGADYDNYWNIIGIINTSMIMIDGDRYALDAIISCTLGTETLDEGTRIDGMTMETLWYYKSDEFTRTYTFDMYIVPKVAEPSKDVPVNGFWTLADNSTSATISLETTANGIAVYDVDWYDNNSATPFLTVNDLSTFVPIMIGETFSVIIDSTSRADYEGYYANMYIFGDSSGPFWGFAKTSVVSIEGTQITFTDWTATEGQQVTLDGLVAYLAPDGTYTSVTDTFETDFSKPVWTAFFQRGGQAMTIGGSINSPTILNDTGPLDITVSYTTGSDRVSGIEFTIDMGGDTPIEHQTTMSIQPIKQTRSDVQTVSYEYPFYESDGYEPSKYMFSVIPIEEESGGGGSGVSDSLRAMVSAIPIVMIAGLVIMGVGFMRMGQ